MVPESGQDPLLGKPFLDRRGAGRRLAGQLLASGPWPDLTVLALPRGGVPVGYEVARALHAPLDVVLVRKLGLPAAPEVAMGAVASGGVRVLNEDVLRVGRVSPGELAEVEARERAELGRRERAYREGRPPAPVAGRTVVVVDDGLATGATMRAALLALRALSPAHLIAAVPVAPPETVAELEADKTVCLLTPPNFRAVGQFYGDFRQTTDDEVRDLLARAAAPTPEE